MSEPSDKPQLARLPSRRFLWISGALVAVLVLAAVALRWGPQWAAAYKDIFTDGVVQRRVVLDDLTGTVRLEEVTRKGKVQVRKQEVWVKDNHRRQQEILRGMEGDDFSPLCWVVRVAGSASAEYVNNALMKPLLSYGLTRDRCSFEIVSSTGSIRKLTCAVFWSSAHVSAVFIGVYDDKTMSSLLQAKLEPVRLTSSTEWAAYLKRGGVSHVTLFNRDSKTDKGNGYIVFVLGVSRYTKMIDLCDAYAKLTDIGISCNNIYYAETKRKPLVDGDVPATDRLEAGGQ